METIFDWLTVLIFAGLAVLYLQRSAADEPEDSPWHYLPPAAACAGANYAGNNGYPFLASGLMLSVLVYVYYVLKPRFRA